MGIFDFLKRKNNVSTRDVISNIKGRKITDDEYRNIVSGSGWNADSYRAMAENGDNLAQYNLGICYREGYGISVDYQKAIEWFMKSADSGNVEALAAIGSCYSSGGPNLLRNMEKAFEYWQKGYEKGDPDCAHNMGFNYEMGNGVTKDIAKAVSYYQVAAEKGVAMSQYNLGICFYAGNGVTQNQEKALYWWKKAAAQGHKEAKHNVSVLS